MQPIGELWGSRNQSDWDNALKRYWENPSVKQNLIIENYMHNLKPGAVKGLDPPGWYSFLDKYFRWKFNRNYLPMRLNDLKSNNLEQLFRVKESLFAFDEIDLANIRKGLNTVKSPQIRGLGYAGASGLLAVLFPKWFGTADKFLVKALSKIGSLRERPQVLAMVHVRKNPKGKEEEDVRINEKDAVLLIDIMRRKATELNATFGPDHEWTPREIDMILWASPRDGADARCLSRTTS